MTAFQLYSVRLQLCELKNKGFADIVQNIGYWNNDLGWNKHYFDFKDVNTQLSQLLTAWDNGRVKNGYEWKTVLYVNKV